MISSDKILKKTRRNLKDYGFVITLKKVPLFLFQPVFDSKIYRIYSISLGDEITLNEPAINNTVGLTFKVIDQDGKKIISRIEDMEEWLEGKVVSKINEGSLCLVAMNGEEVAGFNITSFNRVYLPLVKMHRTLRTTEAWSEQITVNSNYRGKGVGASLRLNMFRELKKRGIRKFYGGTLISNSSNLRLSRKVGFREVADIHYKKFFNFKFWSYKRVRQ